MKNIKKESLGTGASTFSPTFGPESTKEKKKKSKISQLNQLLKERLQKPIVIDVDGDDKNANWLHSSRKKTEKES